MCKYKKNGVCNSPIPVKCSDECGFKHETDLYNGALKELEETRNELEILKGQYKRLLEQHKQLLKEISFTN